MKKELVMLAFVASTISSVAQTAPSFSTSQTVSGFNQINNSGYGGALVPASTDSANDGSTASSNLSGSKIINGVDGSSNSASMTLAYDSEAEVSSGAVKTKASATLTNGFYNPAENDPFVTDTSFNTDPNGVPESFSIDSRATYSNSFVLTGDSALDHIQFAFHLDGTFSGNQGGGIQLYQTSPSFDAIFLASDFSHGSSVDELINSNHVNVIGGLADLDFYIRATIQYDFYDGFFGNPGTDILTGTSDFFNTLTLGEISGFDDLGNPVDLISASDSSGFEFETVRVQTVPVPAAAYLFCSALIGLGALKHRKS